MKTLIAIPTYNEANNIGKILNKTLEVPGNDILVIDDNSEDQTRAVVRGFFDTGRVFMLERPAKLGLGTAYIDGFQWGFSKEYDLFFEMDADNSHNPASIPAFVER